MGGGDCAMTDDKDTKATQETRDLLNSITPERTRPEQAAAEEAEKADVKTADAETSAPATDTPAEGTTTS